MNGDTTGQLSPKWTAWNYKSSADTGNSQLDEKTLEALLLVIVNNDYEVVCLGRKPTKK